jgi:hypothetical protein
MTLFNIIEPAAEVREDEQVKFQRLVAQGLEAAGLEAEGALANYNWLKALEAAYPSTPLLRKDGTQYGHARHPKVREIIMQVRGYNELGVERFIKRHRSMDNNALRRRVEAGRARPGTSNRNARVRRAVVELTTKYRLGADPAACMDALVKFLEDPL